MAFNQHYQVNHQIRDKEVRVIGDDGAQLGVMSSYDAYKTAQSMGLDLVKISPTANPPVCKITDYGKFSYELKKKEKEAKKNQKVVELKEIRLSMTIDTNDVNIKARHAEKFLADGNKVKVSLRMRGRQNMHANLGIEVMNGFYDKLKDNCVIDKKATLDGKNIFMILSPKK